MQDYEQLITPGHVAGHRARAIMGSLYKPAVVSYVAGVALAVCAVSGIAGATIGAPAWLDRALTVDSAPYYAAKTKADQAAAAAAQAVADAKAAADRLAAANALADARKAGDAAQAKAIAALKASAGSDDDRGRAIHAEAMIARRAADDEAYLTDLNTARGVIAAGGLSAIDALKRLYGVAFAHEPSLEAYNTIRAANAPGTGLPASGGLQAPEVLAPANQPASPARVQARQALLNATISTPETMASAQHTVAEIEANARILAQGHQDAASAIDRCAGAFNAHIQAIHAGSDTRDSMPGYVADVERCDRDAGLSVGK
jgi:hypothetical protein